MNIELKPRTQLFSLPLEAPANDSPEHRSHCGSAPPHAVIYKPAKSAMTSGRAATKRWLLEFEPHSPPFIEPLMGWTGSAEPMGHWRLTFPTREAAVAYAKRRGLDYEVRGAATQTRTRGSVDRPRSQPMALCPLELLSDKHGLLMTEPDGLNFAVNLAA